MMILRIPLQSPSQNDFSAYRDFRIRAIKTKSIRNAWAAACRLAMNLEGVPRAMMPRRLHIMCYRVQRCRDDANLIGGLKPAVDGLVDAGLLLDDDRKRARIFYGQDVASKSPTKRPMTVISIENIDSQPSQLPTT